ncbi:porin [Halomonas sp. E19]|uniref:porin n=1 Tax=Halomonas sp. E19 TaxID=3397247 RepID=UPI0040341F56
MKKTLLATAIAGALGVSAAAQAATVYDQDGTQVDVYGRINMGVTTGGTDTTQFRPHRLNPVTGQIDLADTEAREIKASGSEFVDVFSRFGFRARHNVAPDLQAFANMEFRPNLTHQNTNAMTIRNSFLGLRGDQWGMVRIGNFDGVVYQAVTSKFEVHEYEGFTAISGGPTGARGDSIQYSTPNLEGFQAHLQVKHASGNGNVVGDGDNSSTVSWQTAVNYQWQDLYLAAGYNQSKDLDASSLEDRNASYKGGGAYPAGEDIWTVMAAYQFTPAFSARVKYEEVSDRFDNDELDRRAAYYEARGNNGAASNIYGAARNLWTVGATFDYGMGEIYADYNRIRSAFEGVDSRNAWTLGANYRFSKPMYVWAEIHDADFDFDAEETTLSDLNDEIRYTVGLRYDF